jgi:hypothetical protein
MENSKIIKEIKKLGKEISPRKDFINLNRDFLLRQISAQMPAKPVPIGLTGYIQFVSQMFRQHMLEPVVVMFLIFGVFLSSSLTINAAFYSLPGSSLYRVKLALESTHAALTADDNQKAELRIEFAQKRVEELDKIATAADLDPAEKKKQIEEVITEFKYNVSEVKDHLAKLNKNISQRENIIEEKEKEKTLKMAMSISSKAQDLAQSFDKKLDSLSEEEKADIQVIIDEAIQSARQTSDSAQQLAEGSQPDGETGEVKGAANDAVPAAVQNNDVETSTPKIIE